jgi:protein AIR1/2
VQKSARVGNINFAGQGTGGNRGERRPSSFNDRNGRSGQYDTQPPLPPGPPPPLPPPPHSQGPRRNGGRRRGGPAR